MEKFHEILLDSAHVKIGKNGITPGMIQHITNLFKRNPMLKVKVLQEIAHEKGIDPFIEILIRELHVYIYDARGFTFIISKRHYPELHEPKNYHKLRKEIIALQEDKGIKTQQDSISTNVPSNDEDFIDYDNEEVQKQLEAFDEEIEEELPARNPHVSEEMVESEKKHTKSEKRKEKLSDLKSIEWRIPTNKNVDLDKLDKGRSATSIVSPEPMVSLNQESISTTSVIKKSKQPPSPKLPPNPKLNPVKELAPIIPSISIENLNLTLISPNTPSESLTANPKKKSTKKRVKKSSKAIEESNDVVSPELSSSLTPTSPTFEPKSEVISTKKGLKKPTKKSKSSL
jgi:RNA-binding protein YhbY